MRNIASRQWRCIFLQMVNVFLMILNFSLVKIAISVDLANKFTRLGFSRDVERILASIILLDESQEAEILRTRAVLDTGDTFSLLPGQILQEYPNIRTEPHFIWGVVNKEQCRIQCKLAKIPIQLIDENDEQSPILNVPIAFALNFDVPVLLGMKNILSEYNYSFNAKTQKFSMKF